MLLLRQSDTTLTDAPMPGGFSDPKYLNRSFRKTSECRRASGCWKTARDPSRAPSAEEPRTAQRSWTARRVPGAAGVLGVA